MKRTRPAALRRGRVRRAAVRPARWGRTTGGRTPSTPARMEDRFVLARRAAVACAARARLVEGFQDSTARHAGNAGARTPNQTLVAASAHYAQAKATLAKTSAQRLPEVDLNAQASRADFEQPPAHQLLDPDHRRCRTTSHLVGPTINYDTDLFGRIRREVEGAAASAQQVGETISPTRASCSPPICRPTTSRCASSTPRSMC